MPDEEVVEETENEGTGNEGQGSSESGSGSQSSGTGLDIASQSGQQEIANAIAQVFHNVNIYLHNTKVEESEANAEENAVLAESYTKGGTNTRTGEDTDNAKYYCEQAESYCEQAESYTKGGTNTRTGEDTDNAMYYYQQITSLINNFPSVDGDYILTRSNGTLSWESILDGDGGSY